MTELESLKENIGEFKAALRNIERAEEFFSSDITAFHRQTNHKYHAEGEEKQHIKSRLVTLITKLEAELPLVLPDPEC